MKEEKILDESKALYTDEYIGNIKIVKDFLPRPDEILRKNNMHQQKILFTPGPLATTKTVKKAMLYDMGARDEELIHVIKDLRQGVLDVIAADPAVYTSMLLQGPATFANESVLTSISAPNSNWLVLTNG